MDAGLRDLERRGHAGDAEAGRQYRLRAFRVGRFRDPRRDPRDQDEVLGGRTRKRLRRITYRRFDNGEACTVAWHERLHIYHLKDGTRYGVPTRHVHFEEDSLIPGVVRLGCVQWNSWINWAAGGHVVAIGPEDGSEPPAVEEEA